MRITRWQLIVRRSLLWVALVGVVGGLFVLPVARAQDGDAPEATPAEAPEESGGEHIQGYRVDNLFPVVVRLFVTVDMPFDALNSASLTVNQASGLQETFALDLESSVVEQGDDFTLLVYAWDLDTSPLPQPFEPVNYRWTVETDDETVSTVTDAFLFVDPVAGRWHTSGRPPLVLHWANARLAGDLLRDDLQATYGLLVQQVDQRVQFEAVIYDADASSCMRVQDDTLDTSRLVVRSNVDQTEYPCTPDLVRSFYEQVGMSFVERPSTGYTGTLDAVVQSLVRTAYGVLWGDTEVPDWFMRGLGAMYRQHGDLGALETARIAARQEALYDLDALSADMSPSAPVLEQMLWGAQSYLMVLYIADQHGTDAPFDLARAIGSQQSFEEAFQDVTGMDLAAFEASWFQWVLSDAAERAVYWTPYQATTPTPTPTASATLPPPTPTVTYTPSATMPPSATVPGGQSATPVVARTRVPTMTPLPPPGFATPAAAEPAPEDQGGDTTAIEILVAVLLIVAVVLMGMMVFSPRRR